LSATCDLTVTGAPAATATGEPRQTPPHAHDVIKIALDADDAVAVADGAATTVPPTLNPRDAEFADHDPVYLKLHGSAHGAACRRTGHVQLDVPTATLPH
jgi:hypothetical protein